MDMKADFNIRRVTCSECVMHWAERTDCLCMCRSKRAVRRIMSTPELSRYLPDKECNCGCGHRFGNKANIDSGNPGVPVDTVMSLATANTYITLAAEGTGEISLCDVCKHGYRITAGVRCVEHNVVMLKPVSQCVAHQLDATNALLALAAGEDDGG